MAERTTVEILEAAKSRISDPEHWTVETYARTADNCLVDAGSPSACKSRAVGSLLAEFGGDSESLAMHDCWLRLDNAARTLGFSAVIGANDSLGHPVTLAIYDQAIQLAEQEAEHA